MVAKQIRVSQRSQKQENRRQKTHLLKNERNERSKIQEDPSEKDYTAVVDLPEMDLTPKQSTPWWSLLQCCRRNALDQADDDEEMESNVDNLPQPVTECTSETT